MARLNLKKRRSRRRRRRVYGGGPLTDNWAPPASNTMSSPRDAEMFLYNKQKFLEQRDKKKPSKLRFISYLDYQRNKNIIPENVMQSIQSMMDSPDPNYQKIGYQRLEDELKYRDIMTNPTEYLRAWKEGKHRESHWRGTLAKTVAGLAATAGTAYMLWNWGIPGLMNPLSGGIKNAFAKDTAQEDLKNQGGTDKDQKKLDENVDKMKQTGAEIAGETLIDGAKGDGGENARAPVEPSDREINAMSGEEEMKQIEEGYYGPYQSQKAMNYFDDLKTKKKNEVAYEKIKADRAEAAKLAAENQKNISYRPSEMLIDTPGGIQNQEEWEKYLLEHQGEMKWDNTDRRFEGFNPENNTFKWNGNDIDTQEYHKTMMGSYGQSEYKAAFNNIVNNYKKWEKKAIKDGTIKKSEKVSQTNLIHFLQGDNTSKKTKTTMDKFFKYQEYKNPTRDFDDQAYCDLEYVTGKRGTHTQAKWKKIKDDKGVEKLIPDGEETVAFESDAPLVIRPGSEPGPLETRSIVNRWGSRRMTDKERENRTYEVLKQSRKNLANIERTKERIVNLTNKLATGTVNGAISTAQAKLYELKEYYKKLTGRNYDGNEKYFIGTGYRSRRKSGGRLRVTRKGRKLLKKYRRHLKKRSRY